MATIDYKEKYEQALEKARQLCAYPTTKPFISDLQDLFPELAESEDERIRKALIRFHKSTIDVDGIKGKDIISWLEAQGENSVCKVKIGETYKCIASPRYTCFRNGDIYHVKDNFVAELINTCSDCFVLLEKQGEQKPFVIIPKFRIGDEIKTTNEEPLTITKIDEKGYWSEDLFICGFEEECCWDLVEQKPYGQRQECTDCQFNYAGECKGSCQMKRDEQKTAENVELSAFKDKLLELFQRFGWYCKDEIPTNGDIIEYVDAHIQELIKTIQKPAWSEEDKEILRLSLENLTELKDRFGEGYGKVGDCINWLKSLKERYTWKPSDEQMTVFKMVFDWYNRNFPKFKALDSLYNDLNKLKEIKL